MLRSRRHVMKVMASSLAAGLAGVTLPAWSASNYPRRTIKFFCAFPAGNSADIAARLLSKELQTRLGTTVIVENHPGASGTIAAALVKEASPDGYTLLMTSTSLVVNDSVMKDVPYDLKHDFSAVSLVNSISAVLLVNKDFPANNLAEFIAVVKKHPGKYSYGHPGIGTIQNMSAKLFQQKTGTSLTEVPYKGSVEAITDIIGGRLDMMFEADNSAFNLVKTGKLKAIASTGTSRFFGLPDLPTMKESGVDVEVVGFTVMMASSKTPGDIVTKLNTEISAILQTPEMIASMHRIGLDIYPTMSAAQTEAQLLTDQSKWQAVAMAAGIKKV